MPLPENKIQEIVALQSLAWKAIGTNLSLIEMHRERGNKELAEIEIRLLLKKANSWKRRIDKYIDGIPEE